MHVLATSCTSWSGLTHRRCEIGLLVVQVPDIGCVSHYLLEDAVSYIRKRRSIDLSLDTMRHWPACPRTNTGPIFPKASVKALALPP